MRWLTKLFERLFPRPTAVLQLPVFYVVIENPDDPTKLQAHETTRSIHRARGIARQKRAEGLDVGVATYTAETFSEDL